MTLFRKLKRKKAGFKNWETFPLKKCNWRKRRRREIRRNSIRTIITARILSLVSPFTWTAVLNNLMQSRESCNGKTNLIGLWLEIRIYFSRRNFPKRGIPSKTEMRTSQWTKSIFTPAKSQVTLSVLGLNWRTSLETSKTRVPTVQPSTWCRLISGVNRVEARSSSMEEL